MTSAIYGKKTEVIERITVTVKAGGPNDIKGGGYEINVIFKNNKLDYVPYESPTVRDGSTIHLSRNDLHILKDIIALVEKREEEIKNGRIEQSQGNGGI